MIDLKPQISPFTIEHLSKSIRTGELLAFRIDTIVLGPN